MTEPELRRATVDDRDELLQLLSAAFSWPRPPSLDFLASDPHLLSDARIGDHLLWLEGGRMIGVVGLYDYDLRVDGVALRAAAIGQVATAPQQRGRGVMRQLMRAAMAEVEANFDVSWLSGERRRYAPWGFAPGGLSLSFQFDRRMLPEPSDPSEVECLWPDDIVEAIVASRDQLASTLVVSRDELAQLVSARRPVGARWGPAWLIHDLPGNEVWFAGGPQHELGRLLAHVISSTAKPGISATCADEPNDLNRLGTMQASAVRMAKLGLWRIGGLARTLAATARVAHGRVGPGRDLLALHNRETDERATLHCVDGELHVETDGTKHDAITLDTEQLSALCFGAGPLELWLPQLRRDSPLRQVLPLRPFHSSFYRF